MIMRDKITYPKAPLAQSVERMAYVHKVPGSSPGRCKVVKVRVCSSVVEHMIADHIVIGSNPVIP